MNVDNYIVENPSKILSNAWATIFILTAVYIQIWIGNAHKVETVVGFYKETWVERKEITSVGKTLTEQFT